MVKLGITDNLAVQIVHLLTQFYDYLLWHGIVVSVLLLVWPMCVRPSCIAIGMHKNSHNRMHQNDEEIHPKTELTHENERPHSDRRTSSKVS